MSEPALDSFLRLPRLRSLHLSPDGARLVMTVQMVAPDGRRFSSAMWELRLGDDPAPRPLTQPGNDETARGFTTHGDLLFTAPDPPPAGSDDAEVGRTAADPGTREPPHALFLLPAAGGDPRRVLAPDAGIGHVLTGRASTTVVVTAAVHPGSATLTDDAARELQRREAGVQARLIDHYPDRYWDHDIGPRQPRLLAIEAAGDDSSLPPRDLTPDPPWAGWLEETEMALSDDGSAVAFGSKSKPGAGFKADLAVVATSGAGVTRRLIDADVEHGPLAWSPDGSTIAVASTDLGSPESPARFRVQLVDAPTGAVKELAPSWGAAVHEITWTRRGDALLVTADERGHTPVFRLGLDGTVTRLTAAGAYSNLTLSPDGSTLYAIRSHINQPPVPVALTVDEQDQHPVSLSSPVPPPNATARLEEVSSSGTDGAPVHSWLVLPADKSAEALPLAVFIHGGPISSWAGWHWRWAAPLLAAQGWAVLLPNPRLSTGYGHEHIAAAWTDWATLPAADILGAVEAAASRDDIDADRVAALGGSYGGYMANWLAVTSDRFSAIVTHASVWDLEMERDTSDCGLFMDREFGAPRGADEAWRRQSPHMRADALHTPMLVIHGARDQRVPLGNSQALWLALQQRGVASRLLVFPDENHWILKPQNARLWYQTVLAFLDENVRGEPWRRPPLV